MMFGAAPPTLINNGGTRRRRRYRHCMISDGTFDDFVKFAAIQPYAAALRAIVDFDSLTLAHHQLNIFTSRALHIYSLRSFVLTQ